MYSTILNHGRIISKIFKGWFMYSHLYSGAYSSEIVEPIPGLPYNIPLAYLCIIGVNILINFIAVSISMTASYQRNYVDTSREIKSIFCNKIFSAWDYAIKTEYGAHLQKCSFCKDIKEFLHMKQLSERKMTLSQKILQKVSITFATLLVMIVVGSVGYLTYYLLHTKAVMVSIPVLHYMTFAITATVISSFFFYLLKYTTIFEVYISKKIRFYLTMIRVVLLRTIILGMVIYFWMVVYKPPREEETCYEAELGSEFYRLILVNLLMALIVFTFLAEFVRKLLHVYGSSRIGLREFDIAYHTLDLIYFQTLAWLAMFCVPLASLIIIIILVILFYTKMTSMINYCHPPKKAWPINEMKTFYLMLTLFMLIFAAIALAYTIFTLNSSYCGPLKDYRTVGDFIKSVFLHDGMSQTTKNTIIYLTSPGVLFVIFCALCAVAHHARVTADTQISIIKKIRETLILASKDKVFLLRLFDEAFDIHLKNKMASRIIISSDNKKHEKTLFRP